MATCILERGNYNVANPLLAKVCQTASSYVHFLTVSRRLDRLTPDVRMKGGNISPIILYRILATVALMLTLVNPPNEEGAILKFFQHRIFRQF